MNISPDQLLAALAQPIRLRALLLLLREGELCVCELTHALAAPQPTISRHLAQLRELTVVADRRAGHWVYYRLHDELPGWVSQVLREVAVGAAEQEPYLSDHAALTDMPNRPGAPCCA